MKSKTCCCFLSTVLFLAIAHCALAESVVVVSNPYEKVDWKHHIRQHGNFHTHTTESDGHFAPGKAIARYRELGYQVLALTDHDKHTWPWTKFGADPKTLAMLAVPGNELSRHHHTLSLFCHLETETGNHETALKEVEKAGGISILAHPGRYWGLKDGRVPDKARDKYVKLFKTFRSIIGIEVFNQANRFPEDRALWDALLAKMMPSKSVWGFANDDSHSPEHYGLNANVMFLHERSVKAVREALENGRFYFTTVSTHPKSKSRDLNGLPVIKSIRHDKTSATILIDATCKGKPLKDKAFSWISGEGNVVHKGPKLDLKKTEGLGSYVRAEIRGTGGKFRDSEGNDTDLGVSYTDGGDGKLGDPTGTKTGDHKLLQSVIRAGGGVDDVVQIDLTSVPFNTYDVIVYLSRESGDDQVITVDDGTTTYYVDQFVGSTAAYNADGDGNVQYVRSTAETEAAATSNANYVRFEGLSGTSQTITAGNNGATWGVGVAGIQIVSRDDDGEDQAPTASDDSTATVEGGQVDSPPGVSIGVHMGNITWNHNPMAPTDEAGVVAQQYWNNLDDDQKLYDENEQVSTGGTAYTQPFGLGKEEEQY